MFFYILLQVLQGPSSAVLDSAVDLNARFVVAVYSNNLVCVWEKK